MRSLCRPEYTTLDTFAHTGLGLCRLRPVTKNALTPSQAPILAKWLNRVIPVHQGVDHRPPKGFLR